MLTLELFDTGYCLASEANILRGGARREMRCHALAALIGHPRHGLTLFDTGYAMRMLDVTARWPERAYRYLTPLRLSPELELVRQLAARGIAAGDVARAIVSHVHADHVAGLRDFPAAEIIVSGAALDGVAGLRGLAALRRGHIPALLPTDFAARVRALPPFAGPPLPGLGPTHDLFGDGSLLLVALPGHARGQIGALVEATGGPVLLAADGAWTRRSIRELRPPGAITNLLVDDPRGVEATLHALSAFGRARPEVRIVPTHCPEVYAELAGARTAAG